MFSLLRFQLSKAPSNGSSGSRAKTSPMGNKTGQASGSSLWSWPLESERMGRQFGLLESFWVVGVFKVAGFRT